MDSADKQSGAPSQAGIATTLDSDIAYQRLAEARVLSCTGQSAKALEIALNIWDLAENQETLALKARCFVDIAWYRFQLGQPELAYEYARWAVDFWANSSSATDEAEARSIAGWLLLELSQVAEATEEVMQALALAETCGDQQVYCLALNVVGLMFRATKRPRESIDFCHRAVALARELGDPVRIGRWLINLGCAHALAARCASGDNTALVARELETALALLKEAVTLARQHGDTWAARICLANSAEYLIELKDFSGAEQCLLAYREVSGDQTTRNETHFLYTLGQVLLALGRLDEARFALDRCVALSEQNGNIEAMMYAFLYLSDVHERLNNLRLSFSLYKKYHETHLRVSAELAEQRERLATALYENKKLKVLARAEGERAQQIAASYAQLKLDSERIAAAIYIDPLTGLYNRRHLELILPGLIVEDVPNTIAMIDIDFFKTINDSFSHIVGDQVLVRVGELIRRMKRECDEAIRFGGEEFLLIVRGLSSRAAHEYIDCFRRAISAWQWDTIANGLSVTVSIGLSNTNEAATTQLAIEKADRRLYLAKQGGRNRSISCG